MGTWAHVEKKSENQNTLPFQGNVQTMRGCLNFGPKDERLVTSFDVQDILNEIKIDLTCVEKVRVHGPKNGFNVSLSKNPASDRVVDVVYEPTVEGNTSGGGEYPGNTPYFLTNTNFENLFFPRF